MLRKGVKDKICKDLKSLGVDLEPEELEKIENDGSDYPEIYFEHMRQLYETD